MHKITITGMFRNINNFVIVYLNRSFQECFNIKVASSIVEQYSLGIFCHEKALTLSCFRNNSSKVVDTKSNSSQNYNSKVTLRDIIVSQNNCCIICFSQECKQYINLNAQKINNDIFQFEFMKLFSHLCLVEILLKC